MRNVLAAIAFSHFVEGTPRSDLKKQFLMADDIFFSSWENMKRMEFATKHLSQSSDSIVFLDIVQFKYVFLYCTCFIVYCGKL